MTNAITRTGWSLQPSTFSEAKQFAELIANSDLAPKDYRGKPGNILVAVTMGCDLGLSPMQALQNISVINGRPSLWGDALLAVCQAHHDFEDISETDDGATATCTVKRKGRSPTVRTFSMVDAKAAGLVGKQGPWTQYPARMRQMRARAFALRDSFADALRGLQSAEEVSDIPVTQVHTTASVVREEAPVATVQPLHAVAAYEAAKPAVRFMGAAAGKLKDSKVDDASAHDISLYLGSLEEALKGEGMTAKQRAFTETHLEAVKAVFERVMAEELQASERTLAEQIKADHEKELDAKIATLGAKPSDENQKWGMT